MGATGFCQTVGRVHQIVMISIHTHLTCSFFHFNRLLVNRLFLHHPVFIGYTRPFFWVTINGGCSFRNVGQHVQRLWSTHIQKSTGIFSFLFGTLALSYKIRTNPCPRKSFGRFFLLNCRWARCFCRNGEADQGRLRFYTIE